MRIKHVHFGVAAAIVLALIAIGGTLALLSASLSPTRNVFSIGKASLTILEQGEDPLGAPWGVDTKQICLENDGRVDGVVRAMVVPQVMARQGVAMASMAQMSEPVQAQMVLGDITLHFAEDWQENWFYNDGYFYYRKVLKPGQETALLLCGVTLTDEEATLALTGKKVEIQILSDLLQARGGAAQSAWGVTVVEGEVSP